MFWIADVQLEAKILSSKRDGQGEYSIAEQIAEQRSTLGERGTTSDEGQT